MIYWKFIDIKNEAIIVQKTLDYIKLTNHYDIGLFKFKWLDFVNYCPEILSCVEDYGIKPTNAATYVIDQNSQSRIHIDYLDTYRSKYRLNIPILNCKNTFTEFFTGGLYIVQHQSDKSPYKEIHPEFRKYCIKQSELELIKPALISIQTPHRVRLETTELPRISLSVYLNRDPINFMYN